MAVTSSARRLRILQVSTSDRRGGAEGIATNLLRIYREQGHDSWLAVGEQTDATPQTFRIPNAPEPSARVVRLLRTPGKALDRRLGREDFRFPGTRRLLSLPPESPDVVHCHNLHGGYFDLRALPWLSARVPVILTLHDAWLLSGHCAHSFDCERWRTGCGRCPDLSIYPAVRRDATAWNWRRKRSIYARSRLNVTTPSRWLMDRVEASTLMEGTVETRVIPNGVDLRVFRPRDRNEARVALGLSPEARIALYVAADAAANPWKDLEVLRKAAACLERPALLLVLGSSGDEEPLGQASLRYAGRVDDPEQVARYYAAADVYVHAAHVDTFPTTVLEALACGTPVAATAVGGVPEQIRDGETGFLVPPRDARSLADALERLLDSRELAARLGGAAATDARARFSLERQARDYLDWYRELAGC